MAFYGPTWNNANRVMPDSAKRKVNIAIYGTDRHDHTPSPVRIACCPLAPLPVEQGAGRTAAPAKGASDELPVDRQTSCNCACPALRPPPAPHRCSLTLAPAGARRRTRRSSSSRPCGSTQVRLPCPASLR
jgi:hypothetical protein